MRIRKNLLMIFITCFVSASQAKLKIRKGMNHFLAGRSYRIDAYLKHREFSGHSLVLLRKTSSQFEIELGKKTGLKKYNEVSKVRACVYFQNSCMFDCHAKLIKLEKYLPINHQIYHDNGKSFKGEGCK